MHDNRTQMLRRGSGLSALLPFICTAACAVMLAFPRLVNPTNFGVESGIRLLNRAAVVVMVDGKCSLPALQAHLYVLQWCSARILAYQLIPVLYFIAAVLFLTQIARSVSGNGLTSALLTTLSCTPLLSIPPSMSFNTDLYEEPLLYAFLFAIAYLWMKHPRRIRVQFVLCVLALLTSAYAWIYWLVAAAMLLVHRDTSLKVKALFLGLGFIPAIWMALSYVLQHSHLQSEDFNYLHPSGFSLVGRFEILRAMADRFSVSYILSGLLIVVMLLQMHVRRSGRILSESQEALRTYSNFSIVSLFLIYASDIFLASDVNSSRFLLPLVWHLPLWFVLAYRAVADLNSKSMKKGLQLWLTAFLIIPIVWFGPVLASDFPITPSEYVRALRADVVSLAASQTLSANRALSIGAVALSQPAFTNFILAPLIEYRPVLAAAPIHSGTFEMLLVPAGTTIQGYSAQDTLTTPPGEKIDVLVPVKQ